MGPLEQTLATNIILLAAALLAVDMVAIAPAWRRFSQFWSSGSRDQKKQVVRWTEAALALPVIFVFSSFISLLLFEESWYYYMDTIFLLMIVGFAVALPIVIYVVPRWVQRKFRQNRTGDEPRPPIMWREVGNAAALGFFALTAFHTLLAAMAAIQVAVGIAIGGQSLRDDFEAARALIVSAPMFLFSGLSLLGLSYLEDLTPTKTNASGSTGERNTMSYLIIPYPDEPFEPLIHRDDCSHARRAKDYSRSPRFETVEDALNHAAPMFRTPARLCESCRKRIEKERA